MSIRYLNNVVMSRKTRFCDRERFCGPHNASLRLALPRFYSLWQSQ